MTGSSARKGVKRSKADIKKRKEQEQEFAKRRQAIAKSNQARVNGKVAKTEKIVDETTVLGNDATVMLEPDMNRSQQQAVRGGMETEVLSDAERRKLAEEFGMVIEDDVTMVNTDVIIQ